jgi:uncharacterized hydrophobic protein (TIGR00271 family)
VAVDAPWGHRLGGRPRTVAEMRETVLLDVGDARGKQYRFWVLLVLSAVIASAGVIADSTATVIGAMIIAPLATPIMGTALSVVTADATALLRAAGTVVLGAAVVVAIGVGFALLSVGPVDMTGNGQVTGRISPSLVDLVAAVATGFAGAFGLARHDVSDVLPGVAIAISLVPPLAVVGIVGAQGEWAAATGALLLFASNAISLIAVGMLVFSLFGFRHARMSTATHRRQLLAGLAGLVVIGLPLAANTAFVIVVDQVVRTSQEVATEWAADRPGERFLGIGGDVATRTVVVQLEGSQVPTDLPDLFAALDDALPDGVTIAVDHVQGQYVELGRTGS